MSPLENQVFSRDAGKTSSLLSAYSGEKEKGEGGRERGERERERERERGREEGEERRDTI